MFDKAYLCLPVDPQVDSKTNRFTFDGGRSRPIFGGANFYKIKEGEHTIVVTSGTGEEWTVSAKVKYDQMLTVKLVLSGKDVSDVLYKVGPAPSMCWGAIKMD